MDGYEVFPDGVDGFNDAVERLAGATVTRVCLSLDGWSLLLTNQDETHGEVMFAPNVVENVRQATDLLDSVLIRARIEVSTLQLHFELLTLSIPADDETEAWQVVIDDVNVVCLPGGGVTLW